MKYRLLLAALTTAWACSWVFAAPSTSELVRRTGIEVRLSPTSPFFTTVPFVKPVPVLDGRADEAVWVHNRIRSEFGLVDKEHAPRQVTQAAVVHDHDYLYVSFVCFEDRMSQLSISSAFPQGARGDDMVAVRLDAADAPDDFLLVQVNAGGMMRGHGTGLTSDLAGIQVVTHLGEDRWSAEMAIPLLLLKVGLDTGRRWQMTLERTSSPSSEHSVWPPDADTAPDAPPTGELLLPMLDTVTVTHRSLLNRLVALRGAIGVLEAAVKDETTSSSTLNSVRGSLLRLHRDEKQVALLLGQKPLSPTNLRSAQQMLDGAERRVQRTRVLIARLPVSAAAQGRPFTVTLLSSMPSEMSREELEAVSGISFALARGETTAVRLAVVPLAGGLRRVMAVSRNIAPADPTVTGPRELPRMKLTPEKAPAANGESGIDIQRYELGIFTLSVTIPAQVAAGRYTGEMVFTADGTDAVRLPLQVQVY